ncbi:MAG TPA: hypothetical protein VK427_15325 [Kofleriaceae bacterium]|nr:hypothetical protein [Kofleriaceae bacterium]
MAALHTSVEPRLLPVIAFDALGVPTEDEMTRCWETPRGWQKMMTYHWVSTARHIYRMRPLVVLEGCYDPQYAIAACAAVRVKNRVVLLDVDAKTRATRLGATPDEPAGWAEYLAENTILLGGTKIDASGTPAEVAAAIARVGFELVTS